MAKSEIRESRDLRSIGAGSFGRIWHHPGSSVIWKVTTNEPSGSMKLYLDYEMHQEVYHTLGNFSSIRIPEPRCFDFKGILRDCGHPLPAELWDQSGGLQDTTTAGFIPSMPKSIRDDLVDLYCPSSIQQAARDSVGNQDCLLRVYLGKERLTPSKAFFSLRNFPMYRNRMVDLNMDIKALARTMGKTLALINWEARVDGRDIEFVLGSCSKFDSDKHCSKLDDASFPHSLSKSVSKLNIEVESAVLQEIGAWSRLRSALKVIHGSTELYEKSPAFQKRHHDIHLWCLDFNQCRSIAYDDRGVDACVSAFFDNDPYYPRPNDQELWTVFKEAYLECIKKHLIDHDRAMELAWSFFLKVERKYQVN